MTQQYQNPDPNPQLGELLPGQPITSTDVARPIELGHSSYSRRGTVYTAEPVSGTGDDDVLTDLRGRPIEFRGPELRPQGPGGGTALRALDVSVTCVGSVTIVLQSWSGTAWAEMGAALVFASSGTQRVSGATTQIGQRRMRIRQSAGAGSVTSIAVSSADRRGDQWLP